MLCIKWHINAVPLNNSLQLIFWETLFIRVQLRDYRYVATVNNPTMQRESG
jgi:hypothetical protein